MNIIGITGRAGAGKSTAAKVLVANHGFVEVALADPIKRICREVFQFTDEQLWGPSECRNAPDSRYPRHNGDLSTAAKALAQWPLYLTPRHALQTLGTEWGRACYPDVWVDIAIRTAQAVLVEDDVGFRRFYEPALGLSGRFSAANEVDIRGVVISDVRFPNEMAAIRAAGGRVWKINRPGAGLAGAAGAHPSEVHVDNLEVDATIFNHAGLAELIEWIGKLLERPGVRFIGGGT